MSTALDTDPEDMAAYHVDETDCLSDEDAADLAGTRLGHDSWDTLFDGDEPMRVFKPDGDLLAVYLPNVIPDDDCKDAYRALRKCALDAGRSEGNRFQASGERVDRVLEDGSMSSTQVVPKEVSPNTGIAGYYDRYPRTPYCRQTAFNVNNPEKFATAVPLFERCDELFEAHVPDRYANQKRVANETVEEWLISETAFTTVTVNVNWQTAVHQDSGDLEEGFGVMPVIKIGDYSGAYFIQPKFRTAYDLTTGDLLLNDVHEWHGNGPFHEAGNYYERMSIVLYYRKKMEECGTPEEELERAKRMADPAATGEVGDHRTFEEPE